ncbi:type VI secretion system-associated protein TagO [Bradyrhizobium australiense]|uniref:Type VI secretion system VasI, EvfG, VC_A0118 n=1 Tax=Bradyrhizobium australiense TaxID=2721161 RepID=A0A7Y4GUG2_9BRAD|nr:type VI secretion system-associated protein TagO [Bradyrhizobium australiense]NOJ41592.1 hypothetical protein [Bradyrhizobium australiense]
MRAFLTYALAATLAGCGCLSPPQTNIEGCTATNGFGCFDRAAAGRPIEPEPALFRTDSAITEIKSAIAPAIEKSSTPAYPGTKTAQSTMIPAKVETSRIPLPPTRSLKTRLRPATAEVAKPVTPASPESAPQQKADTKDGSNQVEALQPGDAEAAAPMPQKELTIGSARDQLADTAWIISETTSPVDYSPLITAVIHSTSSAKDAPSTLAVRCPGARTELSLYTEGAWHASRANEIQVDYQINDQPIVRQHWTLSADGKRASYKGDAVGLLRSLPEGARLKIGVFDRPGIGQVATFQLAGLDSVRKKIEVACKWPS